MKAVIMVAGVGSRLVKKVRHLPKCLLPAGNETILSRCVRLLKKNGITQVIVAAGYRAGLVREEISREATVVTNPFFRVTNSIASLWFAHREVDLYDDLIILNGDVVYQEEVLQTALQAQPRPLMLIDTSRIETADYRLTVLDGCIVQQGKELTDGQTTGEYVGLAVMGKDFVPIYLARVSDLVGNRERYSLWWEEAMFEIRDEFKTPIHVADVKGLFWAEADYVEDVERIDEWFKTAHE
jgi:choline kinase